MKVSLDEVVEILRRNAISSECKAEKARLENNVFDQVKWDAKTSAIQECVLDLIRYFHTLQDPVAI